MVTQINSSTLYHTDFNLWIEETVKQLKAGNFHEIDFGNLIEELESMGKNNIAVLILVRYKISSFEADERVLPQAMHPEDPRAVRQVALREVRRDSERDVV